MAVLFLNLSSQELNTQNETIVLADAQAAVSADDLNKHVPGDKGRYIFYLFKHTFEGDYMESISKGKTTAFCCCCFFFPQKISVSIKAQRLKDVRAKIFLR